MKIKEILITILFLSICNIGLAQLSFADKMFDEKNYESAVSNYLKVYKKEPRNLHVIQRLGISYQKLNRYNEAEKYFAKAVKFKEVDPESFLSYGQLLKNNKKINMARAQFKIYNKRKDSKRGVLLLQSCDSIESWTSYATEIQTENLTVVNSQFVEMSPFPLGDKLFFSSDRIKSKKPIKVDELELDFDVFNIYVYNPKNEKELIELFSKEINSKSNTESSAYFYNNGENVSYTKVYNSGQAVNQMEIHFAVLENDEWVEDKPFNRNSLKYSVRNPVFSNDNKTVYFASDKPDGSGGFDIYVSVKKGLLYGKPINLGPKINTAGAEIPCYIDDNGTLYFSSDYHPGFGGMDIFKSTNNNGWSDPVNLQLPFNSSKDDLGYFPLDATSGYFQSNRDGGLGKDDIYTFTSHPFSDENYYKNISGVFSSSEGPLANMALVILDGNGEIIRTIVTDENGRFEIDNIPSRDEYQILVDEENERIPESAKLVVTNDDNGRSTLLKRIKKGLFNFQALALDKAGDLSLLDDMDESGLPKLTVLGRLESKSKKSVEGKKIFFVDKDGNIIASAQSDQLGNFKFEKLAIDEQYLFQLELEDADIDLLIINAKGKVIGKTLKNKDGQYVYHKFTINPSENPDVRGVFKFGNLPADGVTLNLLDENDELIQFVTTNENGEFEFLNLKSGTSYQIQVGGKTEVPDNATMYIMDNHTGILLPVSNLLNGKFKFETLAPIPAEELSLMDEEDFVIKPRTNLKGQVQSTSSKPMLSGLEIQVQDDNGKVIAFTKTNDKGQFDFFNLPMDDQYLFVIPDGDDHLNIYIINADNDVVGKANKNEKNQYVYHKFSINPSNNPDIRGVFKYGNLPADDVILKLLDEDDQVLQITNTNAQGEFVFSKLDAGKSYKIEVDDSKGEIPENANLFILDEHTGLMLPVSKLANGQFKFETLAPMKPEELILMDEFDDVAIRFNFFARLYGSNDIANKEVQILTLNGKVIATTKTDDKGGFNYENLPLYNEYLLRMSDEDSEMDIMIISKNGRELGTLERKENGDYHFNNNDLNKKVEKVDAKKDVKIEREPITEEYKPVVSFNFDGYELDAANEKNLDYLAEYLIKNPDLSLEINSHTDSKGTQEYNMTLSNNRSQKVKNYLVDKGVERNRIIANSFGETQLLNECSDGVDCPEEKHAENRRVDLKYVKK